MKTKKLLAFHNDPKIQKKYVDRVEAHYKADEIAHGYYWEKGKGCAVGCTVEKSENAHEAMERELGVPKQLAYLEDRLFENMENGDSKEFPLRFIKAINVGSDLNKVVYRFMIWMLGDKKDGVIQYARPDGKIAIKNVISLYERKLKGGDVSDEQWREAASQSRSAAAAAAAAAADAAAYAYAYAYAYADAAADAAYAYAAADAAADAAAARKVHYKKMADKLIKLLKAAK